MRDKYYVGAVLPSGEIVTFIHAIGADYAVYSTNNNHDVFWNWEITDEAVSAGLLDLELLNSKITSRFKGVPNPNLDKLIANAVRVIFESRNSEKINIALAKIHELIEKTPATTAIISRNNHHIVWINENGGCLIQYDPSKHNIPQNEQEFGRIQALARAMLPEKHLLKIQHRLGVAIAAALKNNNQTEDISELKKIEDLIHRLAENQLKINYLLTTVLSALILTILTYIAYSFLPTSNLVKGSLIAISGGFTGTLISILERSKELRISEYESHLLILLQGVIRVCLGGVFGLIAYLAAQSGIAFSLFKEGTTALLLIGIAAGFSERLIPELIQSISIKSKESENQM